MPLPKMILKKNSEWEWGAMSYNVLNASWDHICLYISLKFLTIKNSQLATSDDNGLRHKNSVNSVDNINSSHEMIMSSLHMTLGLRLNSLFFPFFMSDPMWNPEEEP